MTNTNYSTNGVVNSIVNEPVNGNYLRICSWNIEGLFKYKNDCDFISFVKTFHCCALYETWGKTESQFDNFIEGYTNFSKTRKRRHNLGRYSGGVTVFVQSKLYEDGIIKRIFSEFEDCVCILLKGVYLGLTNDIVLCFTYLSPEGSPIYDINTSSKANHYRNLYGSFEIQFYLKNTLPVYLTRILAKLRCSAHELKVEKGKHSGTPYLQRICVFCRNNQIEDEFHFVLQCPFFHDLRIRYIPQRYIKRYPNVEDFYAIMKCKNESVITRLAQYLIVAFQRRADALA